MATTRSTMAQSDAPQQLGDRIRITAAVHGITQQQIADTLIAAGCQVGRAAVGDRFRGRLEWKSRELVALAKAWGCSVDELLADDPSAIEVAS